MGWVRKNSSGSRRPTPTQSVGYSGTWSGSRTCGSSSSPSSRRNCGRTEGWHEKFGLPTRDNGFGHTAEQVNNFPALDMSEFLRYRGAVRQATLAYLDTLTPDDMERVPRERRPEMSLGAMFRQIIGEMYQHVGHIAYLRGLQGK